MVDDLNSGLLWKNPASGQGMTWLEREQILLDLEQLTSDTGFTLEKLFLKRAERAFRVARRPVANDKIAVSIRAASQILNKTKHFFEILR